MKFRLLYDGLLPAATSHDRRIQEKHNIRKVLCPQIKELFRTHPSLTARLDGWNKTDEEREAMRERWVDPPDTRAFPVGGFQFLPLITKELWLACHLDVLWLRRKAPGFIIWHGGDMDNCLKTLFDALRMPQEIGELPLKAVPEATEVPFFCLLEDDALIHGLHVNTDRLLTPLPLGDSESNVKIVLDVSVLITKATIGNLDFVGD